ncbi:hypothetical protein JB92DRAFT_356109 [Gautieria morchelliformis]|nr:hypothetical protein JB92DRAFT_356109 [Gautieria morchelliformis]
MEQHQLFVIAKIPHSRYQRIAAFRHNYLWRRDPLAVCSNFITLVKNKDNALIVEAELAAIGSTQYQELPETPAPFISSMLAMVLAIRLEDQYCEGFTARPLDPNRSSFGARNNDAITVIDVTDPSSPAYCFVLVAGLEHAKVEVPRDVLLAAETYVRAFYPLLSEKNMPYMEENEEGNERYNEEVQQDVEKHINLFKDIRVIERWMLDETWPCDGYGTDERDTQEPESADTEPDIPPLTELCLQKAVHHATSKDSAALEAAISFPGVGVRLLDILAKRDRLSNAVTSAMTTALSDHPERDQSVLDLSPYSLTAKQVIRVASYFPQIQVLNLDKNPHITHATLAKLLPSLPELTRLIIYDCPGISAMEVRTLRFSGSFPKLLAVYHRGYMMMCDEELRKMGTNTDIASTRTSFTFALGLRCLYRDFCTLPVATSCGDLHVRYLRLLELGGPSRH